MVLNAANHSCMTFHLLNSVFEGHKMKKKSKIRHKEQNTHPKLKDFSKTNMPLNGCKNKPICGFWSRRLTKLFEENE